MQTQNIAVIVIAILMTSGLAYAIHLATARAITRGHAKHYKDGEHAGIQQGRAHVSGLVAADLHTLLAITETLRLAYRTWLPLQGTEPHRARVVAQLKLLNNIASRIRSDIASEATPAGQTQVSGEAA